MAGSWREVGTPQDYLDAVLIRLDRDRVVDATAEVHPTAAIGTALIGRGARIGARAVVGASVVAEGAAVGEDAQVLRSVLLGGEVVEAGERLVDEIRASS